MGHPAHSTASSFLPLLLEKDFRPPKGVIPNAKQHWRHRLFLLGTQVFSFRQSNTLLWTEFVLFLFFLPPLFRRPSLSGLSRTLILKIAYHSCPHRSHRSLKEFTAVLLCLWAAKQRVHKREAEASKHRLGRHRYAPTSHLAFPLSSSPVDTRIHIRRSIRREPLEISRNISLTLLFRPDFSTPGGGTPPSSCPGIH